MTEWERQRAHVYRLLRMIAKMPDSPAATIGLRDVRWKRAELVRLLNGVIYERAWTEWEQANPRD